MPDPDPFRSSAIRAANGASTSAARIVRERARLELCPLPLKLRGESVVFVFNPPVQRAAAVENSLTRGELLRTRNMRPSRRQEFTAVRGTLRILLASYSDLRATEIPLVEGLRGKPALDPLLNQDLAFSVSHTTFLAAIAIARGIAVGVDVEFHRAIRRPGLASRVLAPEEHRYLASVADHERQDAFIDLWSAKEAYAKLVGRGVADALRACDFSELPCVMQRLAVGPRHSGFLAQALPERPIPEF
jgi:phosphopantetheinyl transferase